MERLGLNESMREGARAGAPFGVASFVLAISFGVLAEPVMGAAAAVAMSAFVSPSKSWITPGLPQHRAYPRPGAGRQAMKTHPPP